MPGTFMKISAVFPTNGTVLTSSLLAFGRRGPIGQFLESTFGIVLAFRWTGAALAAAIMGFPLLVRAIRLSIEAIVAVAGPPERDVYRRLEAQGATAFVSYPPAFSLGAGASLDAKRRLLARYGDEVIARFSA